MTAQCTEVPYNPPPLKSLLRDLFANSGYDVGLVAGSTGGWAVLYAEIREDGPAWHKALSNLVTILGIPEHGCRHEEGVVICLRTAANDDAIRSALRRAGFSGRDIARCSDEDVPLKGHSWSAGMEAVIKSAGLAKLTKRLRAYDGLPVRVVRLDGESVLVAIVGLRSQETHWLPLGILAPALSDEADDTKYERGQRRLLTEVYKTRSRELATAAAKRISSAKGNVRSLGLEAVAREYVAAKEGAMKRTTRSGAARVRDIAAKEVGLGRDMAAALETIFCSADVPAWLRTEVEEGRRAPVPTARVLRSIARKRGGKIEDDDELGQLVMDIPHPRGRPPKR